MQCWRMLRAESEPGGVISVCRLGFCFCSISARPPSVVLSSAWSRAVDASTATDVSTALRPLSTPPCASALSLTGVEGAGAGSLAAQPAGLSVPILMAPRVQASSQSPHITQRLMSTEWLLLSMQALLQLRAHRPQPLQRLVSITGRYSGRRAIRPSSVPTGHTVLHQVRPPLHASSPMTTSMTSDTTSAGRLFTHTSTL